MLKRIFITIAVMQTTSALLQLSRTYNVKKEILDTVKEEVNILQTIK
jgi:hypothetical protein